MTMTNAEWCIKNGIKLKNLKCEWYSNSSHDSVGCYDSDGIYHEFYKGKALGDTMTESILAWLDMEHKEPILDDAEKMYLSAVIKPFRDKVKGIKKRVGVGFDHDWEEISIKYYDKNHRNIFSFELPGFKKGTMYKGMEEYRPYTLEELGL